jgi:hypothetical protein
MRLLRVSSLVCAGLLAGACALLVPIFSPDAIQASGQPPAGPYGGCAAPTNPGFNICNPGEPNSFAWTTPSGFQLIAAATSGAGQVSLIEVWADGKKVAQANGSPFDQPIYLNSGTHTLTLIEQDQTGSEIKSAPFQVAIPEGLGGGSGTGNNCPAPSAPGVHICNPQPGDSCNSQSWVTFDATGKGASGTVDRMELWIGGTKIANFPGSEIGTTLIMVYGEVGIVEVDSKGHSLSSSFFWNGPC